MNLVERLVGGTEKKLIVVIGDVIRDLWIHGRLEQCQEDCPKFVQTTDALESPGGAANAANCLREWKVRTALFGQAQNDCPVKWRYLVDHKVVFRADAERSTGRPEKYDWERRLAVDMAARADAVLLSDYDKGFLEAGFVREVTERCRTRGIPCVADCKRLPSFYEGAILKGNAEWTERYRYTPDVTTRGPVAPVTKEDGVVRTALPRVPCVNHVGAGDCFAAHLTLALAYGFSLNGAAVLAHSAGRIYVQHPHNRPPLPAEVAADLSAG